MNADVNHVIVTHIAQIQLDHIDAGADEDFPGMDGSVVVTTWFELSVCVCATARVCSRVCSRVCARV